MAITELPFLAPFRPVSIHLVEYSNAIAIFNYCEYFEYCVCTGLEAGGMSVLEEQPNEPFIADDTEAALARAAADRLKAVAASDEGISVKFDSDVAVALPARAVFLLQQILEAMANRIPVSVVPHEVEFTTQQAADYLNVSRPYLIKRLDAGEIAHRKVGRHRRIRFRDLLRYEQAQKKKQRAAMEALSAEEKKLGLE